MIKQQERLGYLTLVTGPTRSGKSDWAEILAAASKQPVLYLATAQRNPQDAEWQARIESHRVRRPTAWATLEVPEDLTQAIEEAPESCCILVDALGTWVANALEQPQELWTQRAADFLEALEHSRNQIVVVAEEVGWGIVPAYESGRRFRDRLGDLVCQTGAIADQVYLVTAGYAIDVKQLGQAVPRDIKQRLGETSSLRLEIP